MKKKILKLKPFQEILNKGMCGPASLKIVLDYYGVDKTEIELTEMTGWKEGLGIDDKGIKRVVNPLEFKVDIKINRSFEDIEKWLDKKVPVIVDWFSRGHSDYSDSAVADGRY